MAWEWIGLGAPLAAAAGAAINELTRRGKRDDERLEFAWKGLTAAKEDLGGDPVLVAAYQREVERVLVSGARVKRRMREFYAKVFVGSILLGLGIFVAQFGSHKLVQNLSDLGTADLIAAWTWVVIGSGFSAVGVGVILHGQATTGGLRRAVSLSDVERDLRSDGREIGGADESA